MTAEALRDETVIVMQEGAGVRQVIEHELRRAGLRLAAFQVRLELGLQESVKSAVAAGYGVAFISRTAVEREVAAGVLATARVAGVAPAREIYAVQSKARTLTRVAEAFLAHARARAV